MNTDFFNVLWQFAIGDKVWMKYVVAGEVVVEGNVLGFPGDLFHGNTI